MFGITRGRRVYEENHCGLVRAAGAAPLRPEPLLRSLAMRLVVLVGVLLVACGDGSASGGPHATESVGKVASKLGGACTSQVTTMSSDHPIASDWWTSSVGSKVTFSTTVQGCSDPKFAVWHALPNQPYTLMRDYTDNVGPNFVWDTTGDPPCNHSISIKSRANGSSAQEDTTFNTYYNFL